MSKKKLFIWGDSPTVPTGFGIVSKNLFSELHKEYDVYFLGINYFGLTKYDTSKWFIFPVDRDDPLGYQRINMILANVQPDKIVLFQDIFNIQVVLPAVKERFPRVPILAYFPIDGSPVNPYWKPAFDTPDKLVTYTKWGIEQIRFTFPDMENKQIEYLYHGVDTNVFYVLPSGPRRRMREERGWGQKFVVVSNNRFQPRKVIALGLRAFALFAKGYKKCKCGNVYLASRKKCDLNGCGPEDVLNQVDGHSDVVAYFHGNIQERMMGPGPANSLAAQVLNAGFTQDDLPSVIQLFNGNVYDTPLSEHEMNMMYNIADVNISTALGEGVGLSLIEAAACGTTSIAPKHSSIPEMLGDTGHVIPNVSHINIAMDNGHMRPVVSVEGVIGALEIEYQKWLANGKKKVVNQAAVDRVNTIFQWEDKRQQMSTWIKEL